MSDDGVPPGVAGGAWRKSTAIPARKQFRLEEHLRVDVPGEITGRYWRITVENGNDPPLPGVIPSLYITPVHLVFEQRPGRSYRLLYGQTLATAPQYDLARRINASEEDVAAVAQLGAEEGTSNYADPRPWTERNRYVLWIVMGIAVLLLGASAILSRGSKAAASEELRTCPAREVHGFDSGEDFRCSPYERTLACGSLPDA